MKETIKTIIIKALLAEGVTEDLIHPNSFVVEHPADMSKGDYSTNVALAFSKVLNKNPKELADSLVSHIDIEQVSDILKIEVAGPGFINFYLSPEYFDKSLSEVLQKKKNFGKINTLQGKKYFFEYTQPNPFKDFHIGHMMNNAIGEALSRIMEMSGAEVKRATYHGDKGLHVAKAIYSLLKSNEPINIKNLGKAYADGNTKYEEDEDAKKEIISLNKKIYEGSDDSVNAVYEEGRRVSFEYFEYMYKKLGSTFDYHFFEREAGEIGKKIVLSFIGDLFEESQGAIIFPGENYGLHTRVFLNSEGLPTYEAKEIGLAKIKKDAYAYDTSITMTANEQDDFFKVVEIAIEKVFPDLEGKLKHLSHGMLKLTNGKMSSRTGGVIPAESFIDEVTQSVLLKMNESDRNIPDDEKLEISEKIAIAAIKYWILKQSIGKDIIFDKERAISLDGDSGPYLQYAHTRALSVIRKATEVDGHLPLYLESQPLVEKSEINLSKKIHQFPEIIKEATELLAPQLIVTYLTELASNFNHFYSEVQIIKKDDLLSQKRIALTSAFSIVMKNGLEVLGIPVPGKM